MNLRNQIISKVGGRGAESLWGDSDVSVWMHGQPFDSHAACFSVGGYSDSAGHAFLLRDCLLLSGWFLSLSLLFCG